MMRRNVIEWIPTPIESDRPSEQSSDTREGSFSSVRRPFFGLRSMEDGESTVTTTLLMKIVHLCSFHALTL